MLYSIWLTGNRVSKFYYLAKKDGMVEVCTLTNYSLQKRPSFVFGKTMCGRTLFGIGFKYSSMACMFLVFFVTCSDSRRWVCILPCQSRLLSIKRGIFKLGYANINEKPQCFSKKYLRVVYPRRDNTIW